MTQDAPGKTNTVINKQRCTMIGRCYAYMPYNTRIIGNLLKKYPTQRNFAQKCTIMSRKNVIRQRTIAQQSITNSKSRKDMVCRE